MSVVREHRFKTCDGRCEERDGRECFICQGLTYCIVCRGGEGSLPTQCPGMRMTEQQEEGVARNRIDFVDGAWVTLGEVHL